jgi:hypothetical protein
MPAASPLAYPTVNGVRHSFASIELKIGTLIFVGFKSINYSRTRSRTLVRGNSPDPLGKTRGDNEYSADCELYLAEWNLLMQTLGKGYGDVLFPINVTYSENGFDTITDNLIGCTIDSTEASQSQGNDALTRKFNLMPLKILFGQTEDLASPLVGVQT